MDALRHAPYLLSLAEQFPDLMTALTSDIAPDDLYELEMRALETLEGDVNAISDLDAVMMHLRICKRRLHLLIAYYDLQNIWTWETVTRRLTDMADSCVDIALRCAAIDGQFTGKDNNPVPGLFVLAVGKYGAHELNYSSDIDIIVFYDPDIVVLPNVRKPEVALLRLIQKMVKILDSLNADGYVFRTDLRLRPDPRSNTFAVSIRSAERYYESLGQNWERAAMIKARVCAGDIQSGQDFIDTTLKAFIWRRSLDFPAIDDIQAMKRQINTVGGYDDINPAGHNLKLGRGGIREIEFYAQTQQLILGGRHKALRSIRTDEALRALAAGGYMDQDTASELIKDYGALRNWEHRAQMMHDAQTHICPENDEDRSALAALGGYIELNDFDRDLTALFKRVSRHYGALYPDASSLASPQGNLSFTGVEAGPATTQTLKKLGFERTADVWKEMAEWLGGRIPATRTQRARESLTRLAPHIIAMCADTGQADNAFFRFSDFFTKLRGGVSLLALFERSPQQLGDIIDMIAQAPHLADVLAQQPEIFDVLIEPDFESAHIKPLSIDPQNLTDLETAMNIARRYVRENHFKISANIILGRIDRSVASAAITAIADNVVQQLILAAQKDVERRLEHPGGGLAVIALGKMGGREMTTESDLDIMVVYDPGADPKPHTHQYFTKATQRLVSALSAPTEEGPLYDVDMALRPSGGSGPITVSLNAFDRYYAKDAWTWEFMAMTRARVVYASNAQLDASIKARLQAVLTAKRDLVQTRIDIADMRLRLERDKGARGPWDIKRMAGGLVDIEFLVQYLQLIHSADDPKLLKTHTGDALNILRDAGHLTTEDTERLFSAWEFYAAALQYLAVSLNGMLAENTPKSVKARLSKLCGCPDFQAFEHRYAEARQEVRAIFTRFIYS